MKTNKRTIQVAAGVACWMTLGMGLANLSAEEEGPFDPEREENTIFLDAEKVDNLGIETEPVFEETFERTVFAIGRIESIPARHGVVSSRIAGRVVELSAFEGDEVIANETLGRIESRQPGNPPPRIDVKAPISGLVTHSHVKLGEPVEPSSEILDIMDLSEVFAVARVPEDQASGLKPGTKAHITIAALGGESFDGEMVRFGTSADQESGTLDAVFLLKNTSGRMRPGMRAEFSIVLSTRDFVMAVPRGAIQGDPASRVVYVKDFEIPHAFVKAPVKVGESNDRYVEIVSGVFPGDEVVVKGAYMLSFSKDSNSMSLKEALDMAHGHEHNADGSEMTAEQKAEREREKALERGEEPGGVRGQLNVFLLISNVVLLVLLILIGMNRLSRRQDDGGVEVEEGADSENEIKAGADA